jgi:SPP1 family predicted phage head-tail adaptor
MPQIRRRIGPRRHRLDCQGLKTVADGDGGYVEDWTPLVPPQRWGVIEPARRRDVEGVTANAAIQAVATHVITMDYHPQLTVESRVFYHGREFQIHAIANENEENRQLVVVCTEVLHGDDGGARGAPRPPTHAAD